MPRHSPNQNTAVSPVVAVILLVAVTVTLSAVIGGFALNLGQSATDGQSQSDVGVSTTESNGQYTATVVTGSADEIQLLVNGSEVDSIQNASAGDTLTANVSAGSDVTVVTVTGGSKSVISSTTVSSTTSSTTGVPTDGLVAAWLFDDETTSATAIDKTEVYNGSISNSTYVSGISDTGLSFPANDSGVNVSSVGTALESNNAFTISGWYKLASLRNYQVAYGKKYYSDGTTARFWFEPNRDDENNIGISGQFNDSSGTRHTFASNYTLTAGEWHHLVWTWDGQNSTFYVNGTKVYEKQTSGFTVNLPADNYIGFYDGPGKNSAYYDGSIDEMYVYNRSLSAGEVDDLYNATK